jgi:predicted transcriptional regulator
MDNYHTVLTSLSWVEGRDYDHLVKLTGLDRAIVQRETYHLCQDGKCRRENHPSDRRGYIYFRDNVAPASKDDGVKRTRMKKGQLPTPGTLNRRLWDLLSVDEGITTGDLARLTGRTSTQISANLQALRKVELARRVGTNSAEGYLHFKMLPDELNADKARSELLGEEFDAFAGEDPFIDVVAAVEKMEEGLKLLLTSCKAIRESVKPIRDELKEAREMRALLGKLNEEEKQANEYDS